ncbi:glycosyltransferase family 2 protein [Allofrancisella frigidaquae]|uniref:Glycosyltransferase family 2 protein n=1 Tax=Allofrancisella frigidaquae TaxID=1085644 RepID=A0A6M3HUD6_9GAMM|nr:glycosyltransferase family 2 protein [Allofrancisella frigidaquae]QIV94848.1 glycosyltransferase family 2 protein [Allofrancisella frigidaquae]
MYSLVSILIPVYNREHLIEETVQSALAQTYENIEIIIVDNKSTDKTWDILQKLASKDDRIKIFQNETNIGPVRNWKRCIDEASGEYGKILWSDDLIAPEFLEKTLPYLENHDVGFVYTKTEIFQNNGSNESDVFCMGESNTYSSESYINGVLFDVNYPVSPGCALFRLKDLKSNLLVNIPNKVNSDFSMHAIGNDLLIFLLTAHQYKKFAFVNEKLSFFRAHADSISVKSDDGKLPLHYALVKAYFIENYRDSLIRKNNVMVSWLLVKYSKFTYKYNLRNISDFYVLNKNFSLNYFFLVKKMVKKIFW